MARNFPDFISAYLDYATDHFCPSEFHKWIGISILASVLERKVRVDQGHNKHFPNLYVMLVSHPGVGKSTAINRGVDLIRRLQDEYHAPIRTIPKSCTDAALIKEMEIIDYFQIKRGNSTLNVPQSSALFYADEASASALQNTCGNFVATMTSFYDCPDVYDKATKGDGRSDLKNICMNLLAGSTFNYLRELVNEKSVLGGFASRLIYVVSKDRKIRETKWDFKQEKDYETRNKLADDLYQIYKMSGSFHVTEEYKRCFERWQPDFDRELISLNSEKLESILARKGTNLIKLSMIVAASESDEMQLTGKHFERAKELIDTVTEDNSFILSRAVMEQRETQLGVNEAIKTFIAEAGGEIDARLLRRKIIEHGTDLQMFNNTFNVMLAGGNLVVTERGKIRLLSVDSLDDAK